MSFMHFVQFCCCILRKKCNSIAPSLVCCAIASLCVRWQPRFRGLRAGGAVQSHRARGLGGGSAAARSEGDSPSPQVWELPGVLAAHGPGGAGAGPPRGPFAHVLHPKRRGGPWVLTHGHPWPVWCLCCWSDPTG